VSPVTTAAIEESGRPWAELGLDQTPQIQISLNSMPCLCFPIHRAVMGHVRNYVITDVIAASSGCKVSSTAPNGMGRIWLAS